MRERVVLVEEMKALLGETLQLGGRASGFDAGTPLLGNLPELDSMAVLNVILALEERFGITVADEEIGAALFESVGSLCAFVEHKQAA